MCILIIFLYFHFQVSVFTLSIKVFVPSLFPSPIDVALPKIQFMPHVILAILRHSVFKRPRADSSPEHTYYFTTFHLPCVSQCHCLPCSLEKSPLLYKIRIAYHIIGKSTLLHIKVMDLMKWVPSFITLLYTRTTSILLSNFIVLSCIYN